MNFQLLFGKGAAKINRAAKIFSSQQDMST